MIYAVLADIHGNSAALSAVLEDCRKRKIHKFILLGDLYTKGTNPQGVYQQIAKLDVEISIYGNTEQWLFENQLVAQEYNLVDYIKMNMLEDEIAECSKMQPYQIMEYESNEILFIHDAADVQVDAIRKETKEKGKKLIVLAGHTHIPSMVEKDEIMYWNPGSVGMPYDQNKDASYGILTLEKDITFGICRVAYDVEKELENAKVRSLPFLESYCSCIEYGMRYNKK